MLDIFRSWVHCSVCDDLGVMGNNTLSITLRRAKTIILQRLHPPLPSLFVALSHRCCGVVAVVVEVDAIARGAEGSNGALPLPLRAQPANQATNSSRSLFDAAAAAAAAAEEEYERTSERQGRQSERVGHLFMWH